MVRRTVLGMITQIIRKLGRNMTDVYLALDPLLRLHVVLKLIEQSGDPLTRIVIDAERRGAQIQKQLREIDPRVVEVYDFGELEGCFFVAMEYFAGRNIAEILQTERRLEAPWCPPLHARSAVAAGAHACVQVRLRR